MWSSCGVLNESRKKGKNENEEFHNHVICLAKLIVFYSFLFTFLLNKHPELYLALGKIHMARWPREGEDSEELKENPRYSRGQKKSQAPGKIFLEINYAISFS